MRETKREVKSVVPIYAAASVWVLYALTKPLYNLWHFLVAGSVTLCTYFISKKIFRNKIVTTYEPEPEPAPVSYGAEVDNIIIEGRLAETEMIRLRDSIKNPEITEKINELIGISRKIVEDAVHDPADVPQIKKFLSYYLPTTIKLLNAYDRMSDQGIEGKNISGTMTRIEEMLDTAIVAYKKQLDSLFADQALDIETDIEVMNTMLAREGLSGKGIQ